VTLVYDAGYAPVLAKRLAGTGVLVVLDNLESLLFPDGAWRDERWPVLLGALAGHGGLSRVVLTSRVLPAGLDEWGGGRVLVEAVHALGRDEALLLARELQGQRGLLHVDGGEEPGFKRRDADAAPGRAGRGRGGAGGGGSPAGTAGSHTTRRAAFNEERTRDTGLGKPLIADRRSTSRYRIRQDVRYRQAALSMGASPSMAPPCRVIADDLHPAASRRRPR
jgi:hypothetical protein